MLEPEVLVCWSCMSIMWTGVGVGPHHAEEMGMWLELGEHWGAVMLLWKWRFSSSPHEVYLRRLLSCTWDWLTFSNGKQGSHPVGQGIKNFAGGSRTGTYQLGNGKSAGSFLFGFNFKELVHSVNKSLHPHKANEAGKGGSGLLFHSFAFNASVTQNEQKSENVCWEIEEQIPEISKSSALNCVQF